MAGTISDSHRWLKYALAAGGLFLFLSFPVTHALGQEMRTWKDSTGRYSIKARLIGIDGTKVKLEREDGTEMEIELSKLSKADRDYLANEAESPFKTADSPFKPSPSPAMAGEGDTPSTVEVDWSLAEPVALSAPSDAWQVTPPETGDLPGFRPRTVSLPPKSGFFEGMKGLAINIRAQRAVVGYNIDEPRPDGATRIVVCDLKSGKSIANARTSGKMAPLAIHDDGQHILMRRDEFGFGNLDRLEIWTARGSKITKSLIWIPYDNEKGGKRDVMWAEFLDDQHLATSSRGGKVAIWRFATAEPVCYFELSDGAVPTVSADRKWIAFCSSKNVGLFDVEQRQIVAMTATPRDLQWPYLAFSPSGRRLGCIAFDHVLVWDVATGELQRDIPCSGINVHGAIAYPDDAYVLCANRFLVDVDSQLKFWQYDGIEQVASVGGTTFVGVSNGDRPGALLATKLPHAAALDMLDKALKQPDLFVFRKGTTVRLNLAGIEATQQARVAQALTSKLQGMGCQVGPGGTIDLVAWVEGPREREVSYSFAGDYKVKEYYTKLRFVYQGQPVWETQSGSVPGMIMLKQGENVEGVLRASEKPNYGFYERVELPRFLQKPQAGQGPNSLQTLGASRITVGGIE